MDIKRYLRVGRADTTRHGFHIPPLLIWMKMAAVLLLVVAVVFIGIAILTAQHQMNARLETLQTMSESEAFRLEHQITAEISRLQDLAKTDSFQRSLLQTVGEVAPASNEVMFQTDETLADALETLRLTEEQLTSVAVVSKSGVVLAISPAPETPPEINRETWTWFDQPISTGEALVLDSLEADDLTGKAGVHIAVPVKRVDTSTEVLGVIYAVVDPTSLAFITSEHSGLRVMVYDRNGLLIIPAIDPIGNLVFHELMPTIIRDQVVANRSGTAHFASPLVREYFRLYGYVSIPEIKMNLVVIGHPDWIVVTQQLGEQTLSQLQHSTNDLFQVVAVGGVIIGLSILAVTFFFSRKAIDLAHIAYQMAEQDTPSIPIPIHSSDEVGVLANALRRLADRLRSQNTQLKNAVEVTQESLRPELDVLLNKIAETMGERSGYRGVGIYVVEPNSQRARLAVAWGTLSEGLSKPGDIVIIGRNSLVGRALMTTEVQHDAGIDAAEFAGVKARPDELVVPFLGKVSGALQVVGSKPHLFLEGDIDILRLIASQIGFILDNRQMLADTQAAREDAEKANRVKSQFLANMSHELRTPLNAVLNFTGFVMDGDTGPVTEEQVSLLSKVYQSGEHLLNLINDILDLSKIEADMMQFLVEEVDLNQILVSTASVTKGLIKDKNIEFAVQIEDHLPIIQGDKRRLRQVLLNLISNAVKFTRQGTVSLEAYSENGGAHISVRDTGVGIAPEDRSLVFQAFQQGKHDYEVSGTGLGLAISKHFVEAHGGKIWFDSEVGIGTTFHVTLPILGMEKQEVSARAAG